MKNSKTAWRGQKINFERKEFRHGEVFYSTHRHGAIACRQASEPTTVFPSSAGA